MGRVPAILMVLAMLEGVVRLVIAKNTNANKGLKLPEELTKDESMRLYKEYNITEEDIMFAKGELSHYLQGTSLYVKVVTMGKVINGIQTG